MSDSACDNCIEETDNHLCDDCQEGIWESALVMGQNEGAAVAFGIIGMFEAIRKRRWKCPTCRCTPSIMTQECSCCADVDVELTEEEMAF